MPPWACREDEPLHMSVLGGMSWVDICARDGCRGVQMLCLGLGVVLDDLIVLDLSLSLCGEV